MHADIYPVSSKIVSCYFNASFDSLKSLVPRERTVLITDENVFNAHAGKFQDWETIVIKAGEQYKQQATVDYIISKLIGLKADRQSYIVGIGGGVVTDITGYVASIYMRGVKFGFVPTTILGMVDAALGGKNGVDVGLFKNLTGTINQPQFLLYDYQLLSTLPHDQWVNGFAEIIKHAAIKDAALFDSLEKNSVQFYKDSANELNLLIQQNVDIKYTIVASDEFETGERKLLNFGHTLGHAVENIYSLPHGHAISIGMVAATDISVKMNSLTHHDRQRIINLLKNYGLPVSLDFDKEKIAGMLLLDKKKDGNHMNFVLLNKIGEAIVKPISINHLTEIFNNPGL